MLASRAESRPFSPAVLVGAPHAGLALLGDGDSPPSRRGHGERQPVREVEDQLAVLRPMMQIRGFLPAFPFALGAAAQAQGRAYEFQLEAGVPYLITARCDAGCHDVDLSLADSTGQMLQSDTDGDDFPTVSFVPRTTGTYRVGVRLTECSARACAYGIAVYRRDAASAPEKRASAADARVETQRSRGPSPCRFAAVPPPNNMGEGLWLASLAAGSVSTEACVRRLGLVEPGRVLKGRGGTAACSPRRRTSCGCCSELIRPAVKRPWISIHSGITGGSSPCRRSGARGGRGNRADSPGR
jgi:hypothetical protein